MPRPRSKDVVVRRAAALAVALALSVPLIGSCGGSSRGGGGNATGGVSASGAGGAGTVTGGTGGMHSAGGSATEGGKHAGGTPNASGTANVGGVPTGGGNMSAGDAGAGGAHIDAGGEGPAGGAAAQGDGLPCGEQRCSAGQICTRCVIQNQTPQICVPNPDQDPTGYASAIAVCEGPPFGRDDCDGPEDCEAGQYCVARPGARCQAEPSTKHFCCFACDQITDCTLCHTDQDCPTGETCQPNQVADSKGCRPAQ